MKYLNENGDELYILHFPGKKTLQKYEENIINKELNRDIIISDKISIISVMNQACIENSYLKQQCDNNNIIIYNTAIKENDWCNTKKIDYILQALQLITTPYVLILDGRDTIIINNLNDKFIETYKQLNTPIIYNASPINYPSHILIESRKEILSIRGKARFLNGGVCIGTKEELIKFYQEVKKEQLLLPNNQSEQLLIRKAKIKNSELVWIDTDNKLFRVLHGEIDTNIKLFNDKVCQITYH